MSKVLTLILALGFILTAASCETGEEYDESFQKEESADGYSGVINLAGLSGRVLIENHRNVLIRGSLNGNLDVRNCIDCAFNVTLNTSKGFAAIRSDKRSTGLRIINTRITAKPGIHGIFIDGDNSIVADTQVRGGRLGIVIRGADSLVMRANVSQFSEDGIRVMNHRVVVRNSIIRDPLSSKGAHYDGIQIIPPENSEGHRFRGARSVGVQIIGNTITDSATGTMQGILGTDGYFQDLYIAQNNIRVGSIHGITINGGLNLRIYNNRVTTPRWGGILIYVSRLQQNGEISWQTNWNYSAVLRGNEASLLNMPTFYKNDCGHIENKCATNRFPDGVSAEYKR